MDVLYLGGCSVQTGVPPGGREHELHRRAWGRAGDGPCPGRRPHASRGATEGLVHCSPAAAFLSFPYMFSEIPSVLRGLPHSMRGTLIPSLMAPPPYHYCDPVLDRTALRVCFQMSLYHFSLERYLALYCSCQGQKRVFCMGGCCS